MSRKAIVVFTSIISVLGIIYYFTYSFDLFALDEERILKETREAYQETEFEKEPFLKKKEIHDFTEFLLRHSNEIMNYNRHDELRKIQLAEGKWTGYENKGDCFKMPTFHKSFIKDYIPPELVDSLYHYSDGLRNNLIIGFTVCTKANRNNLDSKEGSILFNLGYEKKDKTSGSYYLHHNIIKNRKFELNETINSVYDNGLTKDTILVGDLKYTVMVNPYSGW